MSSFEALGLHPKLISSVENMGWVLPRDVQDESIPLILGGADVMIASATGSGKTGALALPILQLIQETLAGAATVSTSKVDVPCAYDGLTNTLTFTLNAYDCDEGFSLSDNRLLGQCRIDKKWAGCRATVGMMRGRWYFEVTQTDAGMVRAGVTTKDGTRVIGTDALSYSLGSGGFTATKGKFASVTSSFSEGSTVGVFLDMDAKTVQFWLKRLDEQTGQCVGEAFKGLPSELMFPAVAVHNGEATVNFAGPFMNKDLNGFKPIASADVSDTSEAEELQDDPCHTKKVARLSTNMDGIIAVIVEPTRELAKQVYDELNKFKAQLDPSITTALCVPDCDKKKVLSSHIVVGSVGSLVSTVSAASLSRCRFVVLDEADIYAANHMDMVSKLHSYLPTNPRPQSIVCSATLHSSHIKSLQRLFCKNELLVDLKGMEHVPDNVDHLVCEIDPTKDLSWFPTDLERPASLSGDGGVGCCEGMIINTEFVEKFLDHTFDTQASSRTHGEWVSLGVKILKLGALRRLLNTLNEPQAIIFCRTRVDCDQLAAFMRSLSHKTNPCTTVEKGHVLLSVLHPGVASRETEYTTFKSGRSRYLICTDVAARGLDVQGLPLVVNLTLPSESESYVHRVGRTGRAGNYGLAISFVAKHLERVWYHECNNRSCTSPACIINYNEQALLREVEERLGHFELARLSTQQLEMSKEQISALTAIKRPGIAKHSSLTNQHVAIVAPQSKKLYSLELEAQRSYLSYEFLVKKWALQIKPDVTMDDK